MPSVCLVELGFQRSEPLGALLERNFELHLVLVTAEREILHDLRRPNLVPEGWHDD